MKFTDGFWHLRNGVNATYAQEAYDITTYDDRIVVHAPTMEIKHRGSTLNRPVLTATISAPLPGVVRVRVEHHRGSPSSPGFAVNDAASAGKVVTEEDGASLESGSIRAHIKKGAPWDLSFWRGSERITGSGHKSVAHITLDPTAPVSAEPAGITGYTEDGLAPHATYMHEQLDLSVGELIFGLGERFGPFIKNGQSIDIWNADGGTSSEQAYKNVPFYLSSRGYGVFVNHPEHVSFEVGSEAVERVQFSVAGEAIEYFIIDGPTPQEVINRYTDLTGKPAVVPAWSYGLWLSTSFTTDYDEETVNSFIDGMRERDIPLSVFHFDCFWMREFNWTDFVWDERTFPEPEAMLSRLHEDKDLRVSVWLNPYIAQRSPLFDEGMEKGYLVRRPDGSVWQWDMWQAGMALVDFTNPEAKAWYQGYVRKLARQGVDAIKTDFGERIPTDVIWHDGTDPYAMHNLYTQLYNQAVWEVLEEEYGTGNAILFARSATAGGQTMPVHWGGDNSSTFVSMAETLRGGLSLATCGFGYWSHDIGGFEGNPDPGVFKRWVAFGLLSSHSRLHGSTSYRVPWAFDDEAVEITAKFARLKNSLMPYLYAQGKIASETGVSIARPMFFDFPEDPTCWYLDRQYMLGTDLLVAPVMSADGTVEFYLPAGTWTSLLTGAKVSGGRWVREQHGFDSLPLYVREGAVIARGTVTDRPDYDYAANLTLEVAGELPDGEISVPVVNPDGTTASFTVTTSAGVSTAAAADGAAITLTRLGA